MDRTGLEKVKTVMSALRRVMFILAAVAAVALPGGRAHAERLTIKAVIDRLAVATPQHPADFSRTDLSGLDLSGIDFKRAVLRGANLFGADLSDADLSGADLTAARLDRATITRSRFIDARMVEVSLILPSAFTTLSPQADEAPNFARADLTGARINAKIGLCDMSGVNLSRAIFDNQRENVVANAHSDLSGCRMVGANLTGAQMSSIRMSLVDLSDAIVTGADLTHVDLSGANLSGVALDQADLTHARLFGARYATSADPARDRVR